MTHEELLQKLADIAHNKDAHEARNDYLLALLAVVKMHRPALDSEMDENSNNETLGCAGCGFDFNYGTWEVNYPCRTIQAIEKELS